MFGNMKEMLKQAQNMKSQMKKIKKELESIEVEGVSANGACKVTMTADMKTQNVEIDETLLSSEAYVIENAINKLKSKNLDAIVVNKIGDFNPISNDFNQIDFINSDLEITPFEKKHKKDVSIDIMEAIYNNVKKIKNK